MPRFDNIDQLPHEFWTTISDLAQDEFKKLLEKVDAKDVLLKLLSQGTIEIDAKIRIVPAQKPKKERQRSKKASKAKT